MSTGVCSGSRCIVSVGSVLGQHCLTFYPECVCEPLRALWLGVTLPPIGSRCRRCGNRGVEREGRQGRSITRCDPLQSGMFSMDIQTNMSMHVCACAGETGGWNVFSIWHWTDKQTGRQNCGHTYKHSYFNTQLFVVFFLLTAYFFTPASSPCTHPLPRHGVHGLSRVVQHICCWHQGPTYGSTLSLQAQLWGSEQNLPAPQWPTVKENCQQDHLRSQTTSTDKCLHFSM